MTLTAFVLLVIAALFHTAWNFLLKRSENRLVIIWWAILIGSGAFLPLLFLTGLPARSVWGWFFLSVLVEIAYYIVLSISYEVGDFSVVYPFARGSAPLFLLVWSTLVLREGLTPGGVIGIAVLVAGLVLITTSSGAVGSGRAKPAGLLLAILLGLLISVYTAIDGEMVKHTSPLGYGILIFFAVPVFTMPLVFWRFGREMMISEIMAQPWKITAIGVFSVAAYLLALFAYQSSKVGYSGTVREISVVFGGIAGWLLLKERFGPWRAVGSAVIFVGMLMIGFLG